MFVFLKADSICIILGLVLFMVYIPLFRKWYLCLKNNNYKKKNPQYHHFQSVAC